MAAVVFALSSRPGLAKHQALEVAALLALRRCAASKITAQAERSIDRAETSEDVELGATLRTDLATGRRPFAHLCDEAVASLSRG